MIVEAFIQLRGNSLDAKLEGRRKGKPSAEELSANRVLRDLVVDTWRTAPGPGGRFTRLSVLCDDEDLKTLTADLHPTAEIIGVWKQDGYQLGIEPVYDDEGNLVGERGSAVFPLNEAAFLDALPDVAGERPTEPYQAHQYAGWAPRIV